MGRFFSKQATLFAGLLVGVLFVREARAIDLGESGGPVLDVTNTTVVAQQFEARQSEGESLEEYGYGMWLNRLNLNLRWSRFSVGTRLDSSLYWRRPADRSDLPEADRPNVIRNDASRFRDAIYPAKIWATYAAPGLEVTAGDAYVQFGRGLVLSMRKVDDLGVDTTLRGGKLQWQQDPFAVTLVAGVANPSRVDEATGRALFLPQAVPGDAAGPQPLYGSDRIIGAQIQAGRGLPITLSTHAVRLTRCAPYRYDGQGRVVDDGVFDAPLGSCEPNNASIFLSTLPTANPNVHANEMDVAGQSVEIPSLWGHGKIYVEGALQRKHDTGREPLSNGNALYASATVNVGIVTNTLEVKSYRNFYPLGAGINPTRASAFSAIAYSAPPTAEVITQDAMFGFFNACVDGGRLRSDWRLHPSFLLYGAAIYAYSKSEVNGGGCDRFGKTVTSAPDANSVHANVWDGLSGFEWQFDKNRSHFFFSGGVRDNRRDNGEFIYREAHVEYTLTKHISGPYSLELTGRHRQRKEENQNIRDLRLDEQPWYEGEHYTALKIAPKWIFSQGIEYKTLIGVPTYYFNGSILYKFTSDSSIRAFVGQQRGGLRCVSGICRVFPAFEGARVDLTLRF